MSDVDTEPDTYRWIVKVDVLLCTFCQGPGGKAVAGRGTRPLADSTRVDPSVMDTSDPKLGTGVGGWTAEQKTPVSVQDLNPPVSG